MPLVAQSPKDRVILGLMTFGTDRSAGARVTSLDEYNRCLDYFQSQGYNEVDTARMYVNGTQEAFTAEAKWKERGLTLATKVYPDTPGKHKPSVLRGHFETSLADLKTDQVDIFYLHAADRTVPFAETLEAVDQMHKEGKFVQLGLSNFTAYEVAEVVMTCIHHGWVRPTVYQAMYNAVQRSIEPELIPACRRYGLDIVVYSPAAGGLLTGKYKSSEIPTDGRFSTTYARQGEIYRGRYFKDTTFDALRIIEEAAQKHHLTLMETALRWLVHHSALKIKDGRDGIIIGVSSLAHLHSNLADLEKGPLPDEVVKALDESWAVSKVNAPNYWHGEVKYTYDTRKALLGL